MHAYKNRKQFSDVCVELRVSFSTGSVYKYQRLQSNSISLFVDVEQINTKKKKKLKKLNLAAI